MRKSNWWCLRTDIMQKRLKTQGHKETSIIESKKIQEKSDQSI